MSRRTVTLLVAGIGVVAAALAAALLPVPYVILSPGPTLNTLGQTSGRSLIPISGHRSYPTNGHLNLVTVSFLGGPGDSFDVLTAVRAWLTPNDAVVPEQALFPTGQSQQQAAQQDTVPGDRPRGRVLPAADPLHHRGHRHGREGLPAARCSRPAISSPRWTTPRSPAPTPAP